MTLVVDPFGWAVVLVPGWLLLVGLPVSARRPTRLSAVDIGYLRGGERGALATAATALYAAGLIVVSRRGLLRRSQSPMRAGLEPFVAAVYAAMPAPARLRALPARSRVRNAVAILVGELSAAGLTPGRARWPLARGILVVIAVIAGFRVLDPDLPSGLRLPYAVALLVAVVAWWAPRRTVAGYRTLRGLRREHADALRASTDDPPDPVDPGAAAAAYALAGVIMPGLAAAFARGTVQRPPDDHPSGRDYDSGPGILS